jgi:hypothetical protein
MIGSTEVTLGKGNIYPEFLVHWCEFFTSGLGQFVSNILSTLLDVVTGESVELCCILFFPKVMGEIDYSVDIDCYCDLIDELAYTQKTGETEVPDHDAV